MASTDQKELASQYCAEIDDYLDKLEKSPYSQMNKVVSDVNRLTLASAVLPILLTFVSAYAYVLTQQLLTLFANLGNVIPPILININKSKLQKCNECAELQIKFTGFKGYVTRLSSLGELKESKLREIDETINSYSKALADYLQFKA